MTTGAKAAIIISVTFAGLLLLCIVSAVGFAIYRGVGGSKLSAAVVPIVMHDEASLSKRHYVNNSMQCRIRLPQSSFTQINSGTFGIQGAQQGFMARCDERSVGVVITNRGSVAFDQYVALNRMGLSGTKGLQNLHIIDEGRCTIAGMDAYEITLSCVVNGVPMRQRQIYVNAPGNKVYLLQGACQESAWYTSADVFDSSFSTFEIGHFAEDPPELPSAIARGGNPPPPPVVPRPPQPPPLHLTFTKASEALEYLRTGKPEERRAALSYLERSTPDAEMRTLVVPAVIGLLNDNTLRYSASTTLTAWATKDDVPLLRGELERLVQQDSGGFSRDGLEARKVLMKLLAGFADSASAQPIAQGLRNAQIRNEARDALKTLGTDAEEAVLELASDRDSTVAREALNLLAAVGTEKSVLPLQRIIGGRDASLASLADDVLKKLATRANLTPDQYLFNLVNHYTIAGPTGFVADAAAPANTRQWTRTAPARAVKSVYTVSVRLVPADYRPQYASNNPQILEAGNIAFKQTASTSTNLTRTVKFVAVDGEYLIELTATMDVADSSAGVNMTNAAKKIQVNEAP